MPRLSRFTPCGMLRMSSRPSVAEQIYRSMVAALNGQYNLEEGQHYEGKIYADAMAMARARLTLERAGNQLNPRRARAMLPALEKDYKLAPGPKDTVQQRQAALAVRYNLPLGAIRSNIETSLRDILGADFLAYRTMTPAEVQNYPTDPSTGPGNFGRIDIPPVFLRLTASISVLGSHAVGYENLDATIPAIFLKAGDTVVLGTEISGQEETIKVTATAVTPRTFTAVFTKAHENGQIVTTMNYPLWISTQRFALIVVKPNAAPEKKRKVHELMQRLARGVSTWAIVPSADGVHVDVFTVADTTLGRVGYAGLGPALAFP